MKHLLRSLIFITTTYLPSQAQNPQIKWRFDTKDAAFGQSSAADLDGDGKLEIVFGCYRNDSMVYVLNAENGSLLWKYNTRSTNFEGCNDAAPLIYDVDADGQLDVVVASSCNPKTFCFNGKTGAVKWICNTRGSDSPPTVADVDEDGKPEILHGQFGGYVLCINAENGTKAWEIAVDVNSWIQTAPTIVDLNNDGKLDFVVATWNASNKANNKVYAYKASNQQLLWTYSVNDFFYHGTAVGDIDKDGFPELVIGNYKDTLYCINGENGTTKWKYNPCNGCYVGAPAAIADLDNDGFCEVITTAWYKVAALRQNGTLFWQYNIPSYESSFRGPAIADINNNNFKDIVIGTSGGTVLALNGQNGTLIFNKNLRQDYGDSLFQLDHAPLIADFDNDGTKDVFIAGGHAEYPNFQNNFGRAYMMSVGTGNSPPWLMFQRDVLRRSNACEPAPSAMLQPNTNHLNIHIFPNPAQQELSLQWTSQNYTDVAITLWQVDGRKVADIHTGSSKPGTNEFTWVRNEQIAAGVYLLKIKLGDLQAYQKVELQ